MPNYDYDVNPDALGVDLATSGGAFGGDLIPTAGGDLEVSRGFENLRLAIFRRLLTPKGSLSKFVVDVDGLIQINEEYGNGAYSLLSEPLSSVVVTQVKEEIITCLAQEPRITVSEVVPSILPINNTYKISYRIDYVVVGSADMQTLSLIQSNGQLEPG